MKKSVLVVAAAVVASVAFQAQEARAVALAYSAGPGLTGYNVYISIWPQTGAAFNVSDVPINIGTLNIATIDTFSVNMNDPDVTLNFAVTAGGVPVTFTIVSGIAPVGIVNPIGTASAGMTTTDHANNGSAVNGLYGGYAYEASYNGGTVFADLVSPFSAPWGRLGDKFGDSFARGDSGFGHRYAIELQIPVDCLGQRLRNEFFQDYSGRRAGYGSELAPVGNGGHSAHIFQTSDGETVFGLNGVSLGRAEIRAGVHTLAFLFRKAKTRQAGFCGAYGSMAPPRQLKLSYLL